ncbi:hypothetical protein B0H19DRAFT_1264991 [Mycena capillaripes]|nr:hypothetical protein B0H19DRAFT_1264991 [Mycena capillaripes]
MSRLPARFQGSQLPGPYSSPYSGNNSAASSSSDHRVFDFKEPPPHIVQQLVRYFLPHASELGFFLDPDRFYDTAILDLPFGDIHRPSTALLCVVYLWGMHFSKSPPPLNFSESDLLHHARQYLSLEILAPAHIQQTIQAQVLLATYFFRNKCLLQAELHANGAATLALGYQLHKLRSMRAPNLNVPGAPPMDAIEEGERIRAFWAVAFLQTSLCLTFNSNRPFCILDSVGAEIDTPWPLEIGAYEAGVLPQNYLGQESVRHLLIDDTFPASPTFMLQVKASVFFYHVFRLPAGQPHTSGSSRMTSYPWLDGDVDPVVARALALTHALTAAAAIKLHQTFAATDAGAQAKCVAAARGILECLRAGPRDGDASNVHPVVGALCGIACSVLMAEVRAGRRFREAWSANTGASTSAPASEGVLITDIRDGMASMAVYAGESSLIAHQLESVQEKYAAM